MTLSKPGITGVSLKICWVIMRIQSDTQDEAQCRVVCTYPLQPARPRSLETGQSRTLSRSSCWPRSWSWTRTPLRARRSRTWASWKTSSSLCVLRHQIRSQFSGTNQLGSVLYLLIWSRFPSCMFCICFFRRSYLWSGHTLRTVHRYLVRWDDSTKWYN